MPIDDARLIHIIGMFKSGTSWLSHILAAHPQVIAWREFDSIRAVYREQHAPFKARLRNRVHRLLNLPPPALVEPQLVLRERQDIVQQFFSGRGWVPLLGEQQQVAAANLHTADGEAFLDAVLRLGGYVLQDDDAAPLQAGDFDKTLGIANTRRGDLQQFFQRVQTEPDPAQIPRFFFDYLQAQCAAGVPIVLKAADQLLCLRQLQQCSPAARKIVIMRDGRDASISATHYGALMKKWQAPWLQAQPAYLERLRAWAVRAEFLARHCREHNILVLRYEDLQRDFAGVCGQLFAQLGMHSASHIVEAVYQKTNFGAASGGRQPGEAAEAPLRRGMVGEWQCTLSKRDARLSWKIAGAQLLRFGYTESGAYLDCDLCTVQ